ncbi:hypothetical protein G7046_g5693 [Stylonectria norvegica]|nr:hypothetical protein G7046_g5693 [Stylonectria norvegica]
MFSLPQRNRTVRRRRRTHWHCAVLCRVDCKVRASKGCVWAGGMEALAQRRTHATHLRVSDQGAMDGSMDGEFQGSQWPSWFSAVDEGGQVWCVCVRVFLCVWLQREAGAHELLQGSALLFSRALWHRHCHCLQHWLWHSANPPSYITNPKNISPPLPPLHRFILFRSLSTTSTSNISFAVLIAVTLTVSSPRLDSLCRYRLLRSQSATIATAIPTAARRDDNGSINSVTDVVTIQPHRFAQASPSLPIQHVEATVVASSNPRTMDSSQHQHHHHHHNHHHQRHHHKSLSQQQSSSSLASSTRAGQQLHTHLPPSASLPLRTANSTPMSSPGLFSPSGSRANLMFPATSVSESNTPSTLVGSPFLHPLQMHKVRETHKALIESDEITGRKLINQYEVIEEIGRGMHGKVKLARNLVSGDNVAIKIIPRFSKKRRLGKVTAMSPQDKTKKEIAILKKIRHPNVVALLEVIDDPELKKIYMVLEHVELGEVVWRKKGLPHICQFERRRIEREMRGELPSAEEEIYEQLLERRVAIKHLKRAKMAQNYTNQSGYWSNEHGAADEPSSSLGSTSRISSREDFAVSDGPPSRPASRQTSRADSRAASRSRSAMSSAIAPEDTEHDIDWEDDMETPSALPANLSSVALDGTMYGAYVDDGFRGRSPSMADSIISHMSSIDYNPQQHDPFADDFSYVPCFSFDQARTTFRDTVLGLEYLHYQGVVHRDIKPANLLWTREHRVKISDFGVSYFGRPIRDGELDNVSESEARDFDDDLELAKTVGTPAFFAPELCYTDIDIEQPKVSEQIDVWSLGVTLYCLIYARIPFLAEDEFQMFRKIATEEVYIPRRRLKPVGPLTSPAGTSLYKRRNTHPYRDDNDLEYEDVDNLLCDLLRQMLTKNPEKRIRLKDIKRHPWVVQGISNPVAWIEETDPAKPSSGRRIQVDEREMSSAVVPLTFLERARSVVKKAVGKVMHPLVERSDSKSRRRATSSAASSAGDSMYNNVPPTPQGQTRGDRRRSLRPDDYFANAIRDVGSTPEHPLAASQTASPEPQTVAYDPLATVLPSTDLPRGYHAHAHSETETHDVEKHNPAASLWPFHRHAHSHGKLSSTLLHLSPPLPVSQTTPTTPFFDGGNDGQDSGTETIRKGRDMDSTTDDSSRSRSVDRGFFASSDKRAQPQVALSTAVAPGSIHGPSRQHRAMRSVDFDSQDISPVLGSPLFSASSQIAAAYAAYQHPHPQSDPNFNDRQQLAVDERPQTAHRVESMSLPPRACNASNRESFARRTQEALNRNQERHMRQARAQADQMWSGAGSCPPSPDEDEWTGSQGAPSRGETMPTTKSSSTESMGGLGTPLTNPSETTSPVSAMPSAKNASERMLAFRSDPSLPALLSGASSVSADMESELLNRPGVVSGHPSLLETTDSLTPPALNKEPTAGYPIEQLYGNAPSMEGDSLDFHLESSGSQGSVMSTPQARPVEDDDYDEDGSDDGILLMAKAKKKSAPRHAPFSARRRDTNISIASTETAKKVPVYSDEGASYHET